MNIAIVETATGKLLGYGYDPHDPATTLIPVDDLFDLTGDKWKWDFTTSTWISMVIPAPAGIHVHTMRQAQGKRGGEFIIDQAESKCIHVVVDTTAQLTDPWLLSIPMEQGSAAYCKDTGKQWLWNGTTWEKP